jgi:hypothetical protein
VSLGKANLHRVVIFDESSVEDLMDVLNAWFEQAGEILLIDVQFHGSAPSGGFSAMVLYQR